MSINNNKIKTDEKYENENKDKIKIDEKNENKDKDKDKIDKKNKNIEEGNKENQSFGSFIVDLVKYIILISLITNLITSNVMQRTIVSGWSMEDTLHEGDNILIEKLTYRTGNLDRFDIISFYPRGKDNEEYYIKRIIGLPGEYVQIINDEIYIDGSLIEEDYGKTDIIGYSGIAGKGIQLDEDEYFVMGDYRAESYDSRYEEIGPIQVDNIEGKAILRIWPLNKIGTID